MKCSIDSFGCSKCEESCSYYRDVVNFDEAFKSYKKGKTIKSVDTGLTIALSKKDGWGDLPIINGKLEECLYSANISIAEINGKWLIID